jgi:Zn-dependent peptidase ImmA (M78 family)
MRNNKRSLIENDAIEEAANGVISAYYLNNHRASIIPPIPVEDIAEHFLGYSIEITNEGVFSDVDLLGGICFETNTIYVNHSIEFHDGRYAFTIAHEIGHHILHREEYLSATEKTNREILCRETGAKPQIEIEADRFAAALLMPADCLVKAVKDIRTKQNISSIGQARGLANRLIKEHGFNNVSNTAMINRLIELELISGKLRFQDGLRTFRSNRFRMYCVIRDKLRRIFS